MNDQRVLVVIERANLCWPCWGERGFRIDITEVEERECVYTWPALMERTCEYRLRDDFLLQRDQDC